MGIVSFSQLLGEICGSILMHFSFSAEVILVDGIRKCHDKPIDLMFRKYQKLSARKYFKRI